MPDPVRPDPPKLKIVDGVVIDSLHWFVVDLLQTLHLNAHDVYKHPLVSRKQDNEAIGVTW